MLAHPILGQKHGFAAEPLSRWSASMAMSQTHHAEVCPGACGAIHKYPTGLPSATTS